MSEQRLEEALKVLKYYADRQGHDGNWNLALAAGEELTERISAAREEGRREGFEKAREMAGEKADALVRDFSGAVGLEQAGSYPKDLLEGCVADARDLAKDIRAMRDGAGDAPPAPEERVSNLCDCTGAPHRREYGCP